MVLGIDAGLLGALPGGGDDLPDDRRGLPLGQRPPVGDLQETGVADRIGPQLEAEPWVADGELLRAGAGLLPL
jgi:hypothetical protein